MFRVLVFMLFGFSATTVVASCYSVMVYHGANPPYSYEESGVYKGLFVDIFAAISEKTGLCFDYLPVSVARGQKLFERGLIDIEPGMHASWRVHSSNPGIYTIDYALSREVILSTKPELIETPKQLYGKVVGRVRGYTYLELEPHFNQDGDDDKIIIYDNTSEKELLAQLQHQRFDYMMIGDITADYYRFRVPEYRNFYEVYEISRLPVGMRLQPNLQGLKARLDSALQVLINEGEIAKIYASYGIRSH
ncbi:ABC-type amino acid transport/signal transduction systems, periplasmic component/domain [Pseudoalteromonas luteoviolacea B = ATCC 29581]|nr:ABC-type amino acid transport/signal transduction systems, periplasmic component/domain [Pseudoalteromonas luteoviolacea B = ATCC 29581]